VSADSFKMKSVAKLAVSGIRARIRGQQFSNDSPWKPKKNN
jgi:hypothetical protein